MDIKQLRYFLHVCNARSMSDAAYAAHISQPALSRQIRLLEDELGVTLFERHPRGITTSEAGLRLREQAVRLVRDAERIRETLSKEANQPRGKVNVGTPSSLRRFLIAPAIIQLHREHPEIQFHIREGTSRSMRDMLLAGETDVAVFSSLEDLGPFNLTPLLSEALFLVGTVGSPQLKSPTIEVTELAEIPLVLTASPNSLRTMIDRAMSQRRLRTNSVIEIESFEMALEIIVRGKFFSVFPYCAIEAALRSGLIEAKPIKDLSISWIVTTVRDRSVSAVTRLFSKTVIDNAHDMISREVWETAKLIEPCNSSSL